MAPKIKAQGGDKSDDGGRKNPSCEMQKDGKASLFFRERIPPIIREETYKRDECDLWNRV